MASLHVPRKWGPKKIPLHEESYSFLKLVASMGFKPFEAISLEESKNQLDKLAQACVKNNPYDGKIEERRVPSRNKRDGVRVRVFQPSGMPEDPCILVYFHGGGHIFGKLEQYESMFRTLSTCCKCIIVAVEFRMCPEFAILDILDDCMVATQWVIENRKTLGGSAMSMVGVGGESSGAQCAIHATHQLKAALDFLIIAYPWIDMTGRIGLSPSRLEFSEGPWVTRANYEWLSDIVVQGRDKEDPRWSPVYHTEIKDVPPTLVIETQLDPIRDDGRRYAKLLVDAGVHTEVLEVKGSIHTFFMLPDHFEQLTRQAYTKIASFLDWLKNMDN